MTNLLSTRLEGPVLPAPAPAPIRGELSYAALSEWQEFALSHAQSAAFHHPRWIRLLQQQYGFELHLPCLKRGGAIETAIPFLACRSLLGRTRWKSLPFTDCLRVLASRSCAAEALVAALASDPPSCHSMSVRTDTRLTSVPPEPRWVRHEVRLTGSLTQLSKNFKPSVQRNLHKGRRMGLRFSRRADANAMAAFYRLHLLTRCKHGVPVQPKSFFKRLLSEVLEPGLGFVGLVHQGEEPVAAGIFLTFNRTMTYKYAASQPAALSARPNDWLVYSALQLACNEGYDALDFGISDRGQEGLRRFKRNWTAVESDVYQIQLVGKVHQRVEDSGLFKLGSQVIRRSPPVVCRCVGEVLYRFLS